MSQFLLYMLKVAVLITVLFVLYKLLLSKLTFHKFNRVVILVILLFSFVVPAIRISLPEGVSRHNKEEAAVSVPMEMNSIAQPSAHVAEMATESETEHVESPLEPKHWHWNWTLIIFIVYCLGTACFIIRKIRSVRCIVRIIKDGEYCNRIEGCDLIESDDVSQPVNWMRYIVMPSSWLEMENKAVWQHESLHARKWHSLDLLLTDLLNAVQWFNPIMVLVRKELELIHEFEADCAVIEFGTPANDYKMMLVDTLAANRGYAMSSWLMQSNLKHRIDMMERKESSRWNMLRAIFIPVCAFAFLFANAQTASVQDENFQWPVFEDGKVWLFRDGTAKVQTFDNVTACMKIDEVAGYLKKYKGYKTTRMTLMYTYPIESLVEAQPLAEQLAKVDIHINVANNEDMIDHMTMPEFRVVRIYGLETVGLYRFEMICNLHEERIMHGMTGKPYTYRDLSISGDVSLMLKWIDLFDGHGLAIYPSENMPCADLQKFAEAAWGRGIEQVSVVQRDKGIITLIPQGTNMTGKFGNVTAVRAVDRMNASHIEFGNAQVIEHPKSSYNPNPGNNSLVKIVRTADMTAIVYNGQQGPDLWIMRRFNDVIKCNGKEYRQTGGYGLEGFGQKYFWSPDWGRYLLVDYFPALPDDAKVVDLCNADGTPNIRNLQVSNSLPEDFYDQFVSMRLGAMYLLKTLPTGVQDSGGDFFLADGIEFTDRTTIVHCVMNLTQPHSFKGYVNDFKLILPGGTEIIPTRVDGVPVGEEFYRGGDFVATRFDLVFPKLETELFTGGDNAVMLTGNVCHEPVSVPLRKLTR